MISDIFGFVLRPRLAIKVNNVDKHPNCEEHFQPKGVNCDATKMKFPFIPQNRDMKS